jgi:hypothetical protein
MEALGGQWAQAANSQAMEAIEHQPCNLRARVHAHALMTMHACVCMPANVCAGMRLRWCARAHVCVRVCVNVCAFMCVWVHVCA